MGLRAANAAAADRLEYEGVRSAVESLRACRTVLACAADGGWGAWADASAPSLPEVARRVEAGEIDGEPPWLAIDAVERDDPEALAAALAAAGAPPPPAGSSRANAARHAASAVLAAAESYVRKHWHETVVERRGDRWIGRCECWPAPFEGSSREECERTVRAHVAEREGALREALARAAA